MSNDDVKQADFGAILEAINEKVYWDMIKAMPTTDEWYDAGMINPDGELLDFTEDTGKKLYHEDLASSFKETMAIWAKGYIRINLHLGILHLGAEPTAEQWVTLGKYVDNVAGVDVYATGGPGDELEAQFNSDAPRRLIMNAIRGYYSGKEANVPDRVLQESIKTLEDLQKAWEEQGIDVDVWEQAKTGYIKLATLIVPKDSRRQGQGSSVMTDLTRYADATGKTIILTAAERDDAHGTTSKARLKKFYKRFGFVENNGDHSDG